MIRCIQALWRIFDLKFSFFMVFLCNVTVLMLPGHFGPDQIGPSQIGPIFDQIGPTSDQIGPEFLPDRPKNCWADVAGIRADLVNGGLFVQIGPKMLQKHVLRIEWKFCILLFVVHIFFI